MLKHYNQYDTKKGIKLLKKIFFNWFTKIFDKTNNIQFDEVISRFKMDTDKPISTKKFGQEMRRMGIW